MWGIALVFLLFVIVSTQTLWLHPRPRRDLLSKPYTSYPDLWIKAEGNKNLIIALHGMYSHPETFGDFGREVSREGWDLFAPVLPNSALDAADLKGQEIYQWEELLRAAFHKTVLHGAGYQKIVLLGHSQGGALALTLAPSLPYLDGLALVAAPLHMLKRGCSIKRIVSMYLSGFLHFIIPGHGGGKGASPEELKELSKIEDTRGPGGFFYALTLHSMMLGQRKMRKRIHLVTQPLFLAYEKNDETVDIRNFYEIKSKAGSPRVHELFTETEGDPLSKKHRLFSYKPVKERLFAELKIFLRGL